MNLPPSHLTVIILMLVCTSIYQKAIEVILMNNDTKLFVSDEVAMFEAKKLEAQGKIL